MDKSDVTTVFPKAFHFDADRLGLIVNFIAVAKALSFVEAADSLGTTASTVSRRISRLEEVLGVRLFERTTRRVALTEMGRIYMDECVLVLERLVAADARISSLSSQTRGILRLTVPVAFGQLLIAPIITEFMRLYPEVGIETNYTDRYVDLIEEGYDLAVRTGNLSDSNLIARKLADNHRIVVAAPQYLERTTVPETPAELAAHECLCFSHYAVSGSIWRFRRDGEATSVRVNSRLKADNSFAIYEGVLAGFGIGVIAHYICHEAIAEGRLVPLLPDWEYAPPAGIYVVQNSSRYSPSRIKTFAEFLSNRFRHARWARRPFAVV